MTAPPNESTPGGEGARPWPTAGMTRGIIAAAVGEATERYVLSLADLDPAAAGHRVNQGHRPAYRGSTSCQRRLPSSTVCEDGIA